MVERKAVLVTGASSGIGAATVGTLTRRGFTVHAGVRRAADGERLAAAHGARCRPLLLDITDERSIAAAATTLAAAGGIYGLVNTAGITVIGPLESVPLTDLRRQFEVNVLGAVALTAALIPLLRRSLGRVVNVGSTAGRGGLPPAGPDAASQAALAALTTALRLELAPFDIDVCYVEPGAYGRPIGERRWRAATKREGRRTQPAREAEGARGDPTRVAATIARALLVARPRSRYR